MSIATNKALIRRLMDEVVNAGNLDVIDEIVAPGFINHNPLPGATPDRDGFRQAFRHLHAAFPDLHVIDTDLIGEGDRVVTLRGFEGTQDGPFMGVPPTGKSIVLDGMTVFRVVNGQIAERWGVLDMLGVMRQLGLLPDQTSREDIDAGSG
ncbi:MAG TPA: ester cyclase [Chloroflexota bacterium]|nr:ester cyclase [Chloroflexota bacterium]